MNKNLGVSYSFSETVHKKRKKDGSINNQRRLKKDGSIHKKDGFPL